MRICEISISNYRAYKDARFEFVGHRANVASIVGRPGAGKTALLNAITWCLYGTESFRGSTPNGDRRPLPLINKGSKEFGLEIGETAARIEIKIEFEDGRRATIRREQVFAITGPNHVEPLGEQVLHVVLRSDNDGYMPVDEPSLWIARHLPERIRPYFILNTERLEQFFIGDGAEQDRVRGAILEIAQIDVLGRIRTRLGKVKSGLLSRKGDRKEGRRGELEDDYETLTARLEAKQEELRCERAALEAANADIADLMARMGERDEFRELIAKQEAAEAGLEEVKRQLSVAEEDLSSFIAQEGACVLVAPAVRELSGEIEEAWNSGRIPAPIHPDFLVKLRDHDQRCICGRGLGPSEQAAFDALVARHQQLSEHGRMLQEMLGPSATLLDRATEFRARLSVLNSAVDELKRRGRTFQERKDAIRVELDRRGLKDADLRLLQAKQDAAYQAKERATTGKAMAERDLGGLETQIKEVERLLKIEMKKDRNLGQLTALVEFTDECIRAADQAYDQLITQTRVEVSDALNDCFLKMMRDTRGETFLGASIDEGFSPHVDAVGGWDAAGDLSGGEDVCLALAFSQALGRVSGFELPLILDSPFVKILDHQIMSDVMRTMLANLEGRQLVLLMKPEEYRLGVQDVLETSGLGEAMRLDFDENTQTTVVS